MKNNRPAIIIGIIILVLLTLVLFRSSGSPVQDSAKKDQINISLKNGDELTVFASGEAHFKSGGQEFIEMWSNAKTSAFFSYFQENYLDPADSSVIEGEEASNTITFVKDGEAVTVPIGDDELIDKVAEDIQEGGDTGGGEDDSGDGDEDISDYFGSPTPSASATTYPTPTPFAGDEGDEETGVDSECLYWRLSYCVVAKTPVPTSTPVPPEDSVALPPDCDDSGNKTTGRTVITNELCLPEEN